MNTQFDMIDLSGTTGTITGTGVYTLNPVDFTAGLNAYSPWSGTTSISENVTIGAQTQKVVIPVSFHIDSQDTITLGASNLYHFGAYDLATNALTLGPNGGGTMSGTLTANVSAVPVPAALPMFGAALIGLGGLARRRAKKAA